MLLKEQLRIAGETAKVFPPGHASDWGMIDGKWITAFYHDNERQIQQFRDRPEALC